MDSRRERKLQRRLKPRREIIFAHPAERKSTTIVLLVLSYWPNLPVANSAEVTRGA